MCFAETGKIIVLVDITLNSSPIYPVLTLRGLVTTFSSYSFLPNSKVPLRHIFVLVP